MKYLTYFLLAIISILANPLVGLTKTETTNQCPTDLETLTDLLLKDIPSYANRVIQRARKTNRTVDLFSYVIIAGRPEFEPLQLNSLEYHPLFPDTSQQVFFTTLERQYTDDQALKIQHYHWLFLTKTENDWRLVTVFSQIGSPQANHPPLPPRETSTGIIGQTINLWLRDCHGGTLRN
jgi:hypothetical protein